MNDRVELLRAAAVGLIALAAASILDWLYPSNEPLSHVVNILMLAGVALTTYAGGWAAGVAAALVPALVMTDEPHRMPAELLTALITYTVVMVLTLAARKRLMGLRESESKLRVLLAAMDDVVMVVDAGGRVLEVVPTKRAPVKMPASELIGKRIHDILPTELADLLVATVRRALSDGPLSVDYPIDAGDRRFHFSGSISPLSESTVLWVARDITARKLAEAALHRANVELEHRVEERTSELRGSEERYRSVFEQIEEIIYTLTPDGIFTSLNPAFERILGWPRAEWIGKPFMSLIPAELQEAAQKLFADLRRDGGIPLSRLVLLGNHGNRVALELTVVDQVIGGRSIGFLGVARDITEREKAEEMLRRSERQLAEAQRSAGLGSYEHDLIARTMLWSDEMFRILGVEPADSPLPFSALENLVVEDDRPKLDEAQRIMLSRGEHEWEMRVRSNDGSEKTLWCTGTVVSNPAQRVLRVIGALKDVTEQRHATRLLEESEERFRLVGEATNDIVWDWNIVSGTVWRSHAFEQLFGYPACETVASFDSFVQRIHPDDRETIRQMMNEALESGQSACIVEYRLRRADGSYAHVLDRGYIVRDAQKRPVRFVGAMMDMTERKLLEDQLEQAKRVSSLGRIAESIAHEFNNVLMGIQPNVEVIQRSSPSGLRQTTDNILRAVRRGKRITDEILRFTRPSEPKLERVQVAGFLKGWRGEIEPLLGPAVALTLDWGSEDLRVLADAAQLAEVLTNLALNARDAMQEHGGTLVVSAHLSKSFGSFPFGVVTSPDRFVHFSVRDEGCGIAAEPMQHLFEPLFTTKEGGLGLGLATAYQIVTRHNGHIFVESEQGIGSTFHIFVPATLALVDEPAPDNGPGQRSIRKVLLVEDETAVASGIAMLLEMEGTTVEIASTGGESIPAIERFSPDLVVLDIGLPDMDGVGVYQEIARRWPNLRVLFSSGHGDSAKLEEYLARPNVGFILKPYDYEAMRAALNQLLESRASQPA